MRACRIGTNKAPGVDGIPNIVLKTAIRIVSETFIDLYNSCLRERVFPEPWKQQSLVLLPKGKKPPDYPSSYRPLCWTQLAKFWNALFIIGNETVIGNALEDNQYGFRKARSTLDAVSVVMNTARIAIAGKRWKEGTKQYCLVATLDVKNAFNSARSGCINNAFEGFGTPSYMRRMVASYLSNRFLRYDSDDGPQMYKVTGGVPQGSVLGLLL